MLFLLFFSFLKLWLNWRLTALQYCVGLCYTSTWISHRSALSWTLFPSPTPSDPSRLSQNTGWALSVMQQIPTGYLFYGLPSGLAGKESSCNAGNPGSVPGSGRFPGEGKGCLLQYSGLGMVVYMFPCYSPSSSHLLLPALRPQVCPLCLRLPFCPANRFISTIFLDSIDVR